MDGATFITHFRQDTMDEAEPPLWSDDLILRYLDEAQREFCRRTEGIEDRISLSVLEGQAEVAIPDTVLKVRAITIPEMGRTVNLTSVEEARAAGFFTRELPPGEPRALVLGVVPGKALLFPAPRTDVTLVLDVMRMPNSPITTAADKTEVSDRFSPTLRHYALFRAYSRPDPETMDRTKADYFLGVFERECDIADKEQGRVRKPNGVTVFSW